MTRPTPCINLLTLATGALLVALAIASQGHRPHIGCAVEPPFAQGTSGCERGVRP